MTQVQDLSGEMLRHELFEDIKISVEPTIWNTLKVTYDMGTDNRTPCSRPTRSTRE